MDKFIFKLHKSGILHVLGSGKFVYYDYEKIAAMKTVIDKYLKETPRPGYIRPDKKPLGAVEK